MTKVIEKFKNIIYIAVETNKKQRDEK